MPVIVDNLIRSSRKTIALIIQRDGTLTVRAPLRMSESRIRAFVETHTDWIIKNKTKIRTAVPLSPKRYAEDETFLFLGQSYPLKIVPRQRLRLDFDGHTFKIAKSALPIAEEVFKKWYKKQAALLLSERVHIQVKKHGFRYQRIRISSARTRWGSCSSTGALSFTYRLMMTPLDVVDYVVVHELVHTQVKNHSKIFWSRVGEIMPDYKTHLAWLKKNGRYLM